MKGFWTGLFAVSGVIAAIAVVSTLWLRWRIDQDVVTDIAVTNAGGHAGNALLVYQPGLSSFPQQVTTAFVDGLAASGWQVATTTASASAPAPGGSYDLIIFGGPVYYGAPGKALARYIARAELDGKPVVILLTAAGEFQTAVTATERLVTNAKGRVVGSFAFTTMRPNDEANKYSGSNKDRALQMARDAGHQVSLASR